MLQTRIAAATMERCLVVLREIRIPNSDCREKETVVSSTMNLTRAMKRIPFMERGTSIVFRYLGERFQVYRGTETFGSVSIRLLGHYSGSNLLRLAGKEQYCLTEADVQHACGYVLAKSVHVS